LAYEHNRLDEADQYLHQCIDLCQQWEEPEHQALASAMLARLEQIRGNPQQTGDATWDAEQLAGASTFSHRWFGLVMSHLARIWLVQGNLEKVVQLLPMDKLSSVEDNISAEQEAEYVILLRLLLARNEYETALHLSERLLGQAEQGGRVGSVIEALTLQALAFQGKNDTEHALAALERALSLAQPEGYVRTFLDEGEPMARLLCRVRSRQAGSAYASQLFAMIDGTSATAQPSVQLLIEPLSKRELEVLKLIEAGCSNLRIANELVISITTVKRHISNIYAKLGVKSRTQAVSLGKELNLFR
jgi:LuxR family maltose regulon positive regulatory protein